jgi:heme/copper-type cytochrome/quinol oxidase subunit 3
VAAELVAGLSLVDVGLAVRPLRVAADSAARGSVDFGGLFVGLSLFLIAGALVFAALLFVFLLERRVEQMGLLLAFGWEPAAVRAVLLFESGLIALVAVVLGVFAGEVYTRLALMGLGGVWADAAGGLQLVYEGRPGTMILAGVLTWLLVLGVLWRSTRFLLGLEPRSLLGGGHALSGVEGGVKTGRSGLKAVVCAVLALGLAFVAGGVEQAELLAGLFFGAGCLLLAAGLFALRRWMLAGLGGGVLTRLSALSLRAIGRRPGRSLAVVGMMAGGIFLVTAVNAFRLNAEVEPGKRDSGTGGFALVGESSLPVYEALDGEEGREAYGLDEEVMSEVRVVPMRVLDGDDASCLNLNRAQRPVLVGVNAGLLAARQAFVFAAGKEVGWGGL